MGTPIAADKSLVSMRANHRGAVGVRAHTHQAFIGGNRRAHRRTSALGLARYFLQNPSASASDDAGSGPRAVATPAAREGPDGRRLPRGVARPAAGAREPRLRGPLRAIVQGGLRRPAAP